MTSEQKAKFVAEVMARNGFGKGEDVDRLRKPNRFGSPAATFIGPVIPQWVRTIRQFDPQAETFDPKRTAFVKKQLVERFGVKAAEGF